MAENTPIPPGGDLPPTDNPPVQPPAASPPPPRKKRHWGRRIALAVAVVVVILIILILLAPTIASTGPVRRFVVAKVNDQLNGKLEVADWSLGWSGPLKISGVHLYDASGQEILSLGSASTQLGLAGALRGHYDLGQTTVNDLNLVHMEVDKDGVTNYQKLVKPSPQASKAPSPPSPASSGPSGPLPQVRGTITVNNLQGTVVAAGAPQPLHIDPSNATIDIPDIDQPIKNTLHLAYHTGDLPPGTIDLAGTVDAVSNRQVDLKQLAADETLTIAGARLDALSPLLRMAKVDLTPSGVANGQIKLAAAGIDHLSANGDIKVAGLTATGPLLKGDTYSTKVLNIPVDLSIASANSSAATITIKTLAVEFDQGKITVAGAAPLDALASTARLLPAALQQATSSSKASAVAWQGGNGQLTVTADVPDIASIANQLPHLLQLQKGLTLSGGALHHQSALALSADKAVLTTATDLTHVAGQADGKPVTLQPLHLSAGATATPSPAPSLHDLKLAMTSGFASVNGSGPSLGHMQLDGQFDLQQLNSQLSQFIDLAAMLKTDQPVQLMGKGSFQLATVLSGSGMNDLSAKGDVKVSNLQFGGGLLHGDTYSTQSLHIPIDLSVASAGSPAAAVQITALGLEVDQGKITLAGHAPVAALASAGRLIPAALTQSAAPVQWQGGEGQLTLTVDVPNLASIANQLPHMLQLQQGTKLSAGTLHHQTTMTLASDKVILDSQTDLSGVAGQNSGKAVALQPLHLSAGATALPSPSPSLHDLKLTMTSGFASAQGGGASLANLKFTGQLDLHDLQTQLEPFLNLTTLLKASAPVQLAGKGAFDLTTQGDPAKTDAPLDAKVQLTLTDLNVAGLTPKAPLVDARLALAAQATVNRSAAGIQGLRGVQFTLQSGPAAQPLIDVAATADTVTLQPALEIPSMKIVKCDIPNLPAAQKQFAAFLPPDFVIQAGSLAAGGQASYVGQKFQLTQPLALHITHLTLDQVQSGQSRHLLADQPVTLSIQVDQPDPNSIHLADVVAQIGDAVTASIKGTVSDLSTQRRLSDVLVTLKYDLAKLWPIARPVVLSPQQQQDYAQMAMSGSFQKEFHLSGAYPANIPFNQAIKSLHADGGVALATFTLPEKGIAFGNADIPFTLNNGILATGAPPAAAGAAPSTQPAPSAVLNAGKVRLDHLSVDLTAAHPTLTTPDNYQLLEGVTLNSVFAKSVLSQFLNNPLFADAKQADGRLDVTIVHCQNLPLDASVMQPDNAGELSLKYSITGLQIGNDLITSLVQYLAPNAFNNNTLQGAIKDGTATLSHGVVAHNTPVSVDKYTLDLSGSVAMATGRFTTPMNLTIPTQLFRQKELTRALPQLTVPLTGTATQPKLDLGKAIQENLGKGLLNQILTPPEKKSEKQPAGAKEPPSAQPPAAQPANPLEDLLKNLGKKKEKKK
jgi:hypothetical protein